MSNEEIASECIAGESYTDKHGLVQFRLSREATEQNIRVALAAKDAQLAELRAALKLTHLPGQCETRWRDAALELNKKLSDELKELRAELSESKAFIEQQDITIKELKDEAAFWKDTAEKGTYDQCLKAQVRGLESENVDLRAELDDYKNVYNAAKSGLRADEVHCACAIELQAELDQLRAELTTLKSDPRLLIPLDGPGSHRVDLAELRVLQAKNERLKLDYESMKLAAMSEECSRYREALEKYDKALVLAISIIKCGEKISDQAAGVFLDAMKAKEALTSNGEEK